MKASRGIASIPLAWLAVCVAPAYSATNVAVFNFQMTSQTPEWVWLEKFLSDQITTDFAGTPRLAVVARDKMQLLARQLHWVPEMATTDARQMGRIRSRLRIEYLVTGVCSVSGGEVTITGQIVRVSTRKELFRKTVRGKAEQVIDLQKKLSAELLSWFTKRPAGQILPTLPVWTRSIPAVRALYEGMDLYDQGRYGEAWLKFRSASGKDRGYVEALYWVGKMYYFMDRYEHARRAYDRFVYMNAAHPRMGDAIKEYLHTYEKLDAPGETLLALYDSFSQRWPEAEVVEPHVSGGKMACEKWLGLRAGYVLKELGRYEEGARSARPVFTRQKPGSLTALENALLHNATTGNTLPRDVLVEDTGYYDDKIFPRMFTLGEKDHFIRADHDRMIGRDLLKRMNQGGLVVAPQRQGKRLLLVAPSGYVFKAIRVYPVSPDDDANVTVYVRPPDSIDRVVCPPVTVPFAKAKREGARVENLPRAGMFLLGVELAVGDEQKSGIVRVEGFRIAPEFERLRAHGALELSCATTPEYAVTVDGVWGRQFDGIIGLLPPGRHKVRYSPLDQTSPYGDLETTVDVVQGKTVPVVGHLPWKKSSPWASWDAGKAIGLSYPGRKLVTKELNEPPRALIDERGVRVVWVYAQDIWTSVSTDGKEFSPPRKLGLPISSAWAEENVRCIRDESGRYFMTFRSNRGAQHRDLCYATWSRDFIHWSAPTVVGAGKISIQREYDIFQDASGRYLLLNWHTELKFVDGINKATRARVNLLISRDGIRWEAKRRMLTIPDPIWSVRDFHLRQRDDGSFEVLGLASVRKRQPWQEYGYEKDLLQVLRARSNDLAHWTVASLITELPGSMAHSSVVYRNGRAEVILFLSPPVGVNYYSEGVRILSQDSEDRWTLSEHFPGIAHFTGTMSYHPKWGYYLLWMGPRGHTWAPRPSSGPYVLHGRSLEPMLATARPPTDLPPASIVPRRRPVIIPPEAQVPVTLPELPLAREAATVRELLKSVHDSVTATGNRYIRVTGPYMDPRFRQRHQRVLDLCDKATAQSRKVAALAGANFGESASYGVWIMVSGYGVSQRDIEAPLDGAVKDGAVDWSKVRLREGPDTAEVLVGRTKWKMFKLDGKWYLTSGYVDPKKKPKLERWEKKLVLLLKGLETLEQRIRDNKVTRSSFDLECRRLNRQIKKELGSP